MMELMGAPKDPVVQYFMNIRLSKAAELSQLAHDDPTLVARASRDGFNGLHLACKYGFISIAEILLEHGILTDEVDHKYGRTFLHWTAMQGHNDIIFLMLQRYHSNLCRVIDCTDKDGHTALMLAVKSGRVETTKLLLAAGARTDITALKAGVAVTVLNMCGTRDLAQVISNAAPSSSISNIPMCENARDGMKWGFKTNIGASISKVGNKKSKLLAQGWMQQSICDAAHDAASNDNRKSRDVMVKLNRDPRELQQELDVRHMLLSHTAGVAPTAPTVAMTTANGGDSYFVQALHAQLLTVPNQPDIWHAILLEKGIIDVHHLYDSMCQKATHSRLHDTRWKLRVVQQVCSVCRQLLDAGMVWYDLKPSNLIAFPAPCDNRSAVGSTGSDTRTGAGKDTKLYKWLQNSDWNTASIVIKATDLSSIFSVADAVRKEHISCTAKFLCPSVAQALSNADVTDLAVDPAHMLWALGMTILQLLHAENKTFYAHHDVGHADQVYAFLCQDSNTLQQLLDPFVDDFAHRIVEGLSTDERRKVCTLLKGLLRVKDTERMGIHDVCAIVDGLCIEEYT